MGFFKDFKRDFAQAVNELMPDKDELAEEYDDEDMVNTFDRNDDMDVAPEDMLENLDELKIYSIEEESKDADTGSQQERPEPDFDEAEKEEKSSNAFDDIPQAEIINESEADNDSNGDMSASVTEMLELNSDVSEDSGSEDELREMEALDEEDMQEGLDDAFAAEPHTSEEDSAGELQSVNLDRDVQDAMIMRENASESHEKENDMGGDSMAEVEAKVDEQDIDSIINDDTTYITKGTTIRGNIETDGGIDIIGSVEGDVSCGGKLIVGGSIKGNVLAGEIYANAAKIEGDISSEGSVKIGVGSVTVGNITASSAVVAGAVHGDIDVQGPVIVDSTAVIMGNIKSRSVQINNGAVIEGFCSQCYSEIDVKSFFG